jgi:Putative zinc-finger
MSAHPSPEQLGAYLDGELEASARAAVDAHLRECAECGAHLLDLSAVDDAARALPLSVPEGYFDEFAPRVRSRLARKTPARWRPPVWGLAAAAALLLAVITPLALQEHRAAAPTTAVDRAAPAPAAPEPAAPSGGVFERDRTVGYKQDEGLRQIAPPTTAAAPMTGAVPQAPAPGAVASKDQDHFEERPRDLRLARGDQIGAATGRAEPSSAPALPAEAELARAKAEPKRENAATEPGTADEAKAQGKLSDEQLEKLRSAGYVAPAPPPVAQRQHGPRSQSAVPSAAAPRKSTAAPESKDKERFATPPDEKAAGADAPAGDLQEQVEVTTQPRDTGQGLAWAKYRSLADGDPPRSDGDARLLREAWRTFAGENPDHPQADEARVRAVEAGVLAYRLGRRQQDREIALRDGRAYLDRPPSPQAARVRAALKTLEPGAP